jgi:hypothetical protein
LTWIDGTGYVVSPRDGVNGVRRNPLARIGLPVGFLPPNDAKQGKKIGVRFENLKIRRCHNVMVS